MARNGWYADMVRHQRLEQDVGGEPVNRDDKTPGTLTPS